MLQKKWGKSQNVYMKQKMWQQKNKNKRKTGMLDNLMDFFFGRYFSWFFVTFKDHICCTINIIFIFWDFDPVEVNSLNSPHTTAANISLCPLFMIISIPPHQADLKKPLTEAAWRQRFQSCNSCFISRHTCCESAFRTVLLFRKRPGHYRPSFGPRGCGGQLSGPGDRVSERCAGLNVRARKRGGDKLTRPKQAPAAARGQRNDSFM